VIRNLEEDVKDALKRRAKRHGRSMEDEVRHILRDAAKTARRSARKIGSSAAARFQGLGLDSDLPELRGRPVQPADFDE
jgi:plasmid stability protein